MSQIPFTPTSQEQRQANSSLALLRKNSSAAKLVLEQNNITFAANSAVVQVMTEVLERFAAGETVTVQSLSQEMSTQEAADYMGVSRPHVVKLLETGKIPFYKVGSHRRVKRKDVLEYDQKITQLREKALAELAAEGQRLGLGY
jgi:excisionase family DNA binding protein